MPDRPKPTFEPCVFCSEFCLPKDDLPPVCTRCLVANPGPPMVLAQFPKDFAKFESGLSSNDFDATVLAGGDPRGWIQRSPTAADWKWFREKLGAVG
jgi:hypothetical protein